MAAAYQTIANTGETVGTTIVLTKPSGTVDGDLMVAVLAWDVGGSAKTLATLSGWTLIKSDPLTYGTGFAGFATYYKVASSEGASYTWTFSGTVTSWGATVRISGQNTTTAIDTSNSYVTTSVATSSMIFVDTITPSGPNELILFPIFANNPLVAISANISAQAITNDNPSWTEVLDYNAAGDAAVLNISYANRTQTTATGNSTATFNGGTPGATYYFGQLIAIKNPSGLKTWDGIPIASVKTIDGIAIASIKTINGVA